MPRNRVKPRTWDDMLADKEAKRRARENRGHHPRNLSANLAGWAGLRRRIIERDGYRCRICGCDPVEGDFNVHHIDYNREHNDDANLVTLCVVCHRAVHAEGYKPELYEDWPPPWGEHPR